jgi:hypothetical protein
VVILTEKIIMRKKMNAILVAMIVLLELMMSFHVQSQETKSDCSVLLEKISGVYEGECKDGLANGIGTSQGKDTYEGKFKNGVPHGSGKYTWENGDIYDGKWKNGAKNGVGLFFTASNGETIKGQWKKDEFIKEIVDPPYGIAYHKNLTNISFRKENDDINKIEILLKRKGKIYRDIYVDLVTATGTAVANQNNFIGFENISIPFKGSIRFKAPNLLGTLIYEYELEFI